MFYARRAGLGPTPNEYTWKDPKAKCILLDLPPKSLVNNSSPKPLFYQPKNSPKLYLLFTPQKRKEDQKTYFVYKYDIKANKYTQFAMYPEEFDLGYPTNFIDYNNDILYIFDLSDRSNSATKLFWKLNLINGSWTNVQITPNGVPLSTHAFTPNLAKLWTWYDNDEKSIHIWRGDYSMTRSRKQNYFIDSFNFENEQYKVSKMTDYNLEDFNIPNGKYWKHLEMKDVSKYNTITGNTLVLGFEGILILIEKKRKFGVKSETTIWCLDLLNKGGPKWYMSNKKLPSYMDGYNRYFVATNYGDLHFYSQYYFHTIICLYDVVPKPLKDVYSAKYTKLIFGYVRAKIEGEYGLCVPDYLKRLVLCFYTKFNA